MTLRLAVVGHTNTGKTSLMRSLLREHDYGEVSDRPGVTLKVDRVPLTIGSAAYMELVDTPGLEDAAGVLVALRSVPADRQLTPARVLESFLDSALAREQFSQERSALSAVVESDAALYVIDAREEVFGRHRDELEILARTGRPVVPLLNFVAGASRAAAWRSFLGELGLHAVASFDTVVYSARDEARLFEKIGTLLDEPGAEAVRRYMGARQAWQRARRHESFEIIAQMLLDIASYERVVVLAPDGKPPEDEVRRLRHAVRGREAQCVQALLGHHRFRAQDVAGSDLPIEGGSWTLDLFSPEALRHFGIRFSSAAAAGAAVGLGLDLALHGLSLGAMTLSGAAIGGLLGAARVHGRRALDRARGFTHMSVDDPALCLLAVRQMRLLEAMERRGHAAVEPIEALAPGSDGRWAEKSVLPLLRRARQYPDWSSLGGAMPPLPTPARRRAVEEIVRELQKHGPLDAPQTP